MLCKFKNNDTVLSLNTVDSAGLTRGVPYQIFRTKADLVEVKNNIGIYRWFGDKRFCLDTPENRRKLQIKKMFENYG